MEELLRIFSEYYRQMEFKKFQNYLAKKIYDSLKKSYSKPKPDDEVKIVTNMCGAINGEGYGKFRFYANKIHGSRSCVEFYNKNKLAKKELADMVILSIATKKKEIIFGKIAFIQNKKEKENVWEIDQDQLYLLQNFPTLKGKTGILKGFYGTDEVIFSNQSNTLGNYGLFQNPGEMILINALNVFNCQKNNKISFDDLKQYADHNNIIVPFCDYYFWRKMMYGFLRDYPEYYLSFFNLPFLNNIAVSYNIYEVIRNWSLFNIGEVITANNEYLFNFSKLLMKYILPDNAVNLSFSNVERYPDFTNAVIFVNHLNLDDA